MNCFTSDDFPKDKDPPNSISFAVLRVFLFMLTNGSRAQHNNLSFPQLWVDHSGVEDKGKQSQERRVVDSDLCRAPFM